MNENSRRVRKTKVLPKNMENNDSKDLVQNLDKVISIWLPVLSVIFTLSYAITACYVYNYPNLEKLVLCNIDNDK